MNFEFLKTAAAAPEIVPGDVAHNADEIVKAVWDAHQNHADLILFPELCLSGASCGDLFHHTTLLSSCYNALQGILRRTAGSHILCAVGMPLCDNGRVYNVCALFQCGRLVGVVPKRSLPQAQRRFFAEPPSQPATVQLFGQPVPFGEFSFSDPGFPGVTVGVTFSPRADSDLLVQLCPSADPELVGQAEYRRLTACAASAQGSCGIVCAGAPMGESSADSVFSGHCLIVEHGTILAESTRFTNGILYSDLDTDRLLADRRTRVQTSTPQNQPILLRAANSPLHRVISQNPFLPPHGVSERCEEILAIQANALKKRVQHLGGCPAVLGLSGGLDSTLALCVAAKAYQMLGIDLKSITAVSMPCFGTTPRTQTNAQKLAEQFGVSFREIAIGGAVERHFADIGQDPGNHDVTYENAQARERTQVLMDLANQQNGLVIGTGDLSELALGWATYNGDHMSMYGVNAGVPKTLVRVLVQYLADTAPPALSGILRDILDTPVSPELLPPEAGQIAQKTEELVGPYQLHDFFLYYTVRYGFSPEKIQFLATQAFWDVYEEDTIQHWLRVFLKRFVTQQFKRSCMPDGPKVGTVGLSPRGSLVMPSDLSASLFL